jgi:hypothetical protein
MSMVRNFLAAAVVVALGGVLVAAEPKSGPQTGDKVPGPFHPLNINGEYAGKKNCLYCQAGDDPTVAIFARTPDDAALQKLIAALDVVTEKHTKLDMNSFVVFCSDEKIEPKLKDLAEKSKLKKVILAIEPAEGPEKYDISKDADVTIIIYKDRRVVANHTFAKGKLTEKDTEKVLADVAKIVK